MTSHHWGDEWFEKYGDDLYTAIEFCRTNWKRYARLGCHGKEKYGTFRHHLYPFYGQWPIHELVKPAYVSYRWPRWLMFIEHTYLSKLVKYTGIRWLIIRWQRYVFNAVLQTAVKRWPHIEDELLADVDDYSWITPGIWGPLDGKKIKSRYWVSVTELDNDNEDNI
jgi:hypothetical protein